MDSRLEGPKVAKAMKDAPNLEELYTVMKKYDDSKALMKNELRNDYGLSDQEATNQVNIQGVTLAFKDRQNELLSKLLQDINNSPNTQTLNKLKTEFNKIKAPFNSYNKQDSSKLDIVSKAIVDKYELLLHQSKVGDSLRKMNTALAGMNPSDKKKVLTESLKKLDDITSDNLVKEGFTQEDFEKIFLPEKNRLLELIIKSGFSLFKRK